MSEREMMSRCCNEAKRSEHKVRRICTERQGSATAVASRPVGDGRVYRRRPPPATASTASSCQHHLGSRANRLKRSTSLNLITDKPTSRSHSSCSSAESLKYIAEELPERYRRDVLVWRVLYSFSKNLSKKRKLNSDLLSSQLDEANETASKLNIQISLLKSIIRSDETIRESWKKRLIDVKKILGAALEENFKLKNDFEEVSSSVDKMKVRMSDLETENNNYKNTQIFLKSESSAFEQQLKRERDNNALLRQESDQQVKKLCKELKENSNEKDQLLNQVEELRRSLDEKSNLLTQSERSLQNTSRLWQNSVKEIQQLNKESSELRKVNKTLTDEIVSLKNCMNLLERNQEQIYKYFSLNIE